MSVEQHHGAAVRVERIRSDVQVEDAIRKIVPQEYVSTILDNMGIPNSSINLSLSDGSMMSPADGEVLIGCLVKPSP